MKPPANIRSTDPVIPTIIIQKPVVVRPVQPVIIREKEIIREPEPVHSNIPVPSNKKPEIVPETIRGIAPKQFPEQFGNNSPINSETIPNPGQKATIEAYKKKGKVGRQRKYEEAGNHGEIPVKEVVLFRHIKGRHWPGMSQDMKEWYDFYYFSKPKRTEKTKDAEDYTRHTKSWERGQRWIAEHEGRAYVSEAMGHSGKVVAYRKRKSS